MSAGDKIRYGIYQYENVIKSDNDKELLEAASYYYQVALQQEKDEKTKSSNNSFELYKRLEKKHPEGNTYLYLSPLLITGILTYELNPVEKTKKEIEGINQKILNLKSFDDLYTFANYYNRISSSIDSVNNNLHFLREYLFRLFDKIVSYPGIQGEINTDFIPLRNISWYLCTNRQFKTALNGLQICWSADSADAGNIGYISMAYILNDQYDNAKRIIEKWKNEPLTGYTTMSTYADGFRFLITSLETSGITHPDFAKAKELLRKK